MGEVTFENALQFIREIACEPGVGNRWYKGNLHVHAKGCDAQQLIESARINRIDFLAITDHQNFEFLENVSRAAASRGRPITMFVGIEITAQEGVHLLALFPPGYSDEQRKKMLGYLELSGTGNTAEASRKVVSEIFSKVNEEGGIIVVPHPFSSKTGLLDSARKMSTKVQWLESGFVRLIQAPEEKLRYVEWDENGQWINRYVLSSATEEQIRASTYCFAPINISDCYRVEDIDQGCSWFRMGEISVDGLKQVACEPLSRIRKIAPWADNHDAIMGLRVKGGYCDGESIVFNSGLNCIVGQNHAGKSAIFDFIRFALSTDEHSPPDVKAKLFSRLSAILGPGGQIELVLRQKGDLYLARRTFQDLREGAKFFRFEPNREILVPTEHLEFRVEVYEQGRIQRLRDDVSRQLDMLDEFAQLQGPRREQEVFIENLNSSANEIQPLRLRRDKLKVDLAGLTALEDELRAKQALLPKEEEERPWASAQAAAESLESLVGTITTLSERLQNPEPSGEWEGSDPVWELFNQQAPQIDPQALVHADLLQKWINAATAALLKIKTAKDLISKAAEELKENSELVQQQWQTLKEAHEFETAGQLAKAGVDSPQELLDRVNELRTAIHQLKTVKQPQLTLTEAELTTKEAARATLVSRLTELDSQIRTARTAKAKELSEMLGGQIEVSLRTFGDRTQYKSLLTQLYWRISSKEQQIKNIDAQLSLVADKLTPLQLAESLQNKGVVTLSNGGRAELATVCGITPHTQTVLCAIAADIKLLNQLQTSRTPDILQIRVRRQGESVFADLTTGLSQGEQSAALLTLTLQSRALPLILDQPEDELGYNYVVNLIVPKILKAKFSRQMLVITHNANIPVLGDADYVAKMENKPKPSGGRQCVVTERGCFESPTITSTLLELEGGKRAFEFRRHRYSLAISQQ